MLQALREEDRSYTEIADAIRSLSHAPTEDLRQLWRRLVFNLMITNVDDHLQNHGFLHVERGQWRLAPAFDLNPFPDKDRESKTSLTEQDGPITDVQMLLARASYFALNEVQALAVLGEVHATVSKWRLVALSSDVGVRTDELEDFAPAFEHEQMGAAASVLAGLGAHGAGTEKFAIGQDNDEWGNCASHYPISTVWRAPPMEGSIRRYCG